MSRNFASARLLLLALCAATASVARAATIHVNSTAGDDTWDGLCETWDGDACGPKATIQAGIDAANPGDEVVIANGAYTGDGNRDLDFDGKAITVRSASGDPAACMIDCQGTEADPHRAFYFHSGEGPDSVVEGLTITNGNGNADGGGVYCWGASPTLNHCAIRGNSATASGGGLCCRTYSSPTLADCTITENSAPYSGGGVCCWPGCSPTFTNCAITANVATEMDGGGFHCLQNSHSTFTNCKISGNRAVVGGGVYCEGGSPTLFNCTISDNTAGGHGGGAFCGGSPTLINCTIAGNSAQPGGYYGGGGGGLYWGGGTTLTTCIVAGNTPDEIFNRSFWPDSSPSVLVDTDSPKSWSSVDGVTYCNIPGGLWVAHSEPMVWPGEGNIDADPLFVDPDGPDDNPSTWEDNDYRLRPDSPCIDAADNTELPPDALDLDGDGDTVEPLPFDLDDNPRLLDLTAATDSGVGAPSIVDMGAYEAGLSDFDGDGVLDSADGCPTDPNKTGPGACGCSVPDTDSDGDGAADCIDGCPDDPYKIEPGACGCGVPDIDGDGDGAANCIDGCPEDPAKIEPGVCGCGVPDTDSDGDGVLDCEDGCPEDPDKTEPGVCGCGVPEDACGDAQQSAPSVLCPGISCPTIATLMLAVTFLGLRRTRSNRRRKR